MMKICIQFPQAESLTNHCYVRVMSVLLSTVWRETLAPLKFGEKP